MKHIITPFKLIVTPALLLAVTGCESTGGGNVSSGTNYGTGMNDPWPSSRVTPPGGPSTTIQPTTGAGTRGGGGR